MDTRRLFSFVRIVDAGSITRAADILHIAQPALSQQVTALEAHFGQQLLIRSKQGVEPTDAGRALYRHAQVILRQVESAQAEVSVIGRELAGGVSVGLAPYSTVSAIALPLLTAVRERYPSILLHINENFGGVLSEAMMTGRMDMALLYDAGPIKGVDFERLLTEELMVVAPAGTGLPGGTGTAISIRELVDLPLLLHIGTPRNGVSRGVHGFLTRDGMPPAELVRAVVDQALEVGRRGARKAQEFARDRVLEAERRRVRRSQLYILLGFGAGLTAAGVDVLSVGVQPTPAVAYLTAAYGADLGVMISASHNPMPDNGIKIFAAGGHKLEDSVEDRIEAVLQGENGSPARPTGAGIGRVRVAEDAVDRYLAHLASTMHHPLTGLTVVVDCAHGAASRVGPEAYEAAGATVIAIGAEPDGLNINLDCGSTHLEGLQKAVLEHGADLGLAHDGDADRCLAVDASGAVVDGDRPLPDVLDVEHVRVVHPGRLRRVDGLQALEELGNGLGCHGLPFR